MFLSYIILYIQIWCYMSFYEDLIWLINISGHVPWSHAIDHMHWIFYLIESVDHSVWISCSEIDAIYHKVWIFFFFFGSEIDWMSWCHWSHDLDFFCSSSGLIYLIVLDWLDRIRALWWSTRVHIQWTLRKPNLNHCRFFCLGSDFIYLIVLDWLDEVRAS